MIRQNASQDPYRLPLSAVGPVFYSGSVHLAFLTDTNQAQSFCGLWVADNPHVPNFPSKCFSCWDKWAKLTGILRYLMDN
jgi:hypothetical protein